MKQNLYTALAILLTTSACSSVPATTRLPAGTESLTSLDPNGRPVDLTPLANYLDARVKTLGRPLYVFNWFNAAGRRATWSGQFDPNEPKMGFDHLKWDALLYFDSLCRDPKQNPGDCKSDPKDLHLGDGNMFGPGLYTSVDPGATRSYGAGTGPWILMQIKLPKGARIVDLASSDLQGALPDDVTRALSALRCGQDFTSLFADAHSQYSRQCAVAFRKVLKNALQIDAFMYRFSGYGFPQDCDAGPNPHRQAALVLTSNARFSADASTAEDRDSVGEVKAFNQFTTGEDTDRIRIETILAKTNGTELPATIQPLLWSDLQGKSYDANVGAWMKRNLFGCGKGSDFDALPAEAAVVDGATVQVK